MLFTRNKKLAVSTFLVKLVNNNCPAIIDLRDGPRNDTRVNLSVVVLIIPLEKKNLEVDRTFFAVTKDFSATSLSVMVDTPRPVDEVMIGFRYEGEMFYARGAAKHLTPMGGSFYQLGFKLEEMVSTCDYPGLAEFSF